MLQLRGEKMSKSLGNLVTIEEFLVGREADVLRLIVLSSHYSKPLGHDDEVVADAKRALQRLCGALRSPMGTLHQGEPVENLTARVPAAREGFHSAMEDDFNTARALGEIFTLLRAINTARHAGVGGQPFTEAQAVFRQLTQIVGLGLRAGEDRDLDAARFIEALIDVRAAPRQEKQWALADTIRDRLSDLGVALEDGPEGTEWR
jgi:cysteinyl-tRNA synthetase